MEIVTNSRLRAFRTCKRLHQFRYELCRQPVARAVALSFGTAFHRGLEAWWRALAVGAASDDALGLALEGLIPPAGVEVEIDEWELARARVLLVGYHARWFDETRAFTILGVEVEFNGPLINPASRRPSQTFSLGGKIDALCLRPGRDRPEIVEHKTTSEDLDPGSNYWTKLRLDGQLSTYYEGARFVGHDVGGCLYDVVRKPALRPRRATPEAERKWKKDGTLYANQRVEDESPEAFAERVTAAVAADPDRWFRRGEVVRLEDRLREHAVDRWSDVRSLRDAQLEGAWPTNPDACFVRHRACDFWPVCSGAASIDDDTLYRDGRRHEELEARDDGGEGEEQP